MSRVKQAIKTKTPVMELVSHFFPEIHVQANLQLTPDGITDESVYDIDYVTDVAVYDGDTPTERFVCFNIKTDDAEKAKAWKINVSVVGLFRYPESQEDEQFKSHMAYVTGQSILYGIVREVVHTLTQKGPFDPIYLPTISFVPEPPAEVE